MAEVPDAPSSPRGPAGGSPAPGEVPVSWKELLHHRRFALFLASFAFGDIGYAVYAVAAPWLAFEVTHDLFDVGVVLACEFGLYALAFVAAPFVDRTLDRRRVLVAGYALQGVAALSMGILAVEGRLSFPSLLVLVSTISLVWDFTWSANNTIPPLLLPKGSLFRASGLAGLLSGGNQVTGFTLGGALILVVGPGGAMLLYGVLNAVSAVLSLGVTTPGVPAVAGTVGRALKEGWKALLSPGTERPLGRLSLYLALQGFFAPGAVLLITDLAGREFAAPQLAYGILFTAFVLGGAVVGIALGQLNPRQSLGRWLIVTPAASALLLLLAPLAAPGIFPSALLWCAIGAAMLSFETCYMVYLQASSPPQEVARTTANVFLFRGSARAVGSLALGALAVALAPAGIAELLGIGLLAVAAVGFGLRGDLFRLRF